MEKIKYKALTFDDVLLLPRYTDFLPSDTKLATKVSKNITLQVPLVSAAMDTVTEAKMAIALAENGGLALFIKITVLKIKPLWCEPLKNMKAEWLEILRP